METTGLLFPKPKHKKHRTEVVLQSTYNRVWSRDKGTCRLCGSGYWLEAHHIKYRSERKDLINDEKNIILLCKYCHMLVHSNKKKYQPLLLKIMKQKDV